MISRILKDNFLQMMIFCCAVCLSAFLLFFVQPLFAKMVLPVLGGSAAVWTTSMLFFQVVLLLGYIYAHLLSTYLSKPWQLTIHLCLALSALFFLPFSYKPLVVAPESPTLWVLFLASSTIGWPFFVISTTAPLLQRWFSYTAHPARENPYFLYAASNLGSMSALISYPFLLERHLGITQQANLWCYLYLFLVIFFMLVVCFVTVNRSSDSTSAFIGSSNSARPTWSLRMTWLILAFIPSSLMLGLTAHVTTDIAAISLFWVLPLALYLLTFILVFSSLIRPTNTFLCCCVASAVVFVVLMLYFFPNNKILAIISHTSLFFFISWFFHAKLAATKPGVGHLTEFFIWLSIGGMLGGVFNALVAPVLFNRVLEYVLVIFVALLLLFFLYRGDSGAKLLIKCLAWCLIFLYVVLVFDSVFSQPVAPQLVKKIWLSALLFAVGLIFLSYKKKIWYGDAIIGSILLVIACFSIPLIEHGILIYRRSFYGSMHVWADQKDDHLVHHFLHGTTLHGLQIFRPEERQKDLLAYYHPDGGFGDIARAFIDDRPDPLRIGILGLGSGAQSCYGSKKDSVIFFEIDRKVVEIASNPKYFAFLQLCPAEMVLGDGRLSLQNQPDRSFDLLFMDAFSSDSVPTHLLTQEAFNLYLSKLVNGGVLIVHVSNRYLDLTKVVGNFKLPTGYVGYLFDRSDSSAEYYVGHAVAIFTKEDYLPQTIGSSERWRTLERDPNFSDWTDDHTNIFSILKVRW